MYQFLDDVYNGLPISLFVLERNENGDYVLISTNKTHDQEMGYKFEVMKGKTLFELVPDFFTQEEAEVLKEKIMLCLKERKDISYRKQINNNEICQIKTLSPVFKDNGEIIRIIVSNMDILKLNDLNHTIHG